VSTYSAPPLIAAILNLSLIFIVLVNNRRKTHAFSYIIYNTVFFLWNLCLFLLYSVENIETAYYINHVLVIATMFSYSSIYYFFYTFTGKNNKVNKMLLYSAFLISVLFLIFHFKFNLLSNELVMHFWGYYPKENIGDRIYGAVFLFYLFYSENLIYSKIKVASGLKKNQYKFIFWGTIIGFSGCLSNFLPLFGLEIYPIGNLTIILFSLSVAYALITVKMININYLVRKILSKIIKYSFIYIFCFFILNIFMPDSSLPARFLFSMKAQKVTLKIY